MTPYPQQKKFVVRWYWIIIMAAFGMCVNVLTLNLYAGFFVTVFIGSVVQYIVEEQTPAPTPPVGEQR